MNPSHPKPRPSVAGSDQLAALAETGVQQALTARADSQALTDDEARAVGGGLYTTLKNPWIYGMWSPILTRGTLGTIGIPGTIDKIGQVGVPTAGY